MVSSECEKTSIIYFGFNGQYYRKQVTVKQFAEKPIAAIYSIDEVIATQGTMPCKTMAGIPKNSAIF